MKRTLRLSCVTAATVALAATATLGAGSARAQGNHGTAFERSTRPAPTAPTAPKGQFAPEGDILAGDTPVFRIAGSNRIQTAIKASSDAWPEDTAQAVVLSRSDVYADALGGAALAGAAYGPLLLTPSTYLHDAVKAEIDRVLGGSGTVYLLGGTGAISPEVEAALVDAGYTVERLGGVDRFDTSVKVAEAVEGVLGGAPQLIFATTGRNFPDGLAAGATAGGYSGVVVLTKDNVIPPTVAAYLDKDVNAEAPVLAVGGQAAAAPFDWDWAYVGKDRYDTASQLAVDFWASPETDADDPLVVGLATGLDWPDALAGGAYVAGWGPLVLTRPTALPLTTQSATEAMVAQAETSPVAWGTVFGGTNAVNLDVESQFHAALN